MFGWFKKKDEEAPQEDAQTLSDIIRGAAHAVAAADEVQDKSFLAQLHRYFEYDEQTNTHTPKYARVLLPGGTHYVDLPLITLMDPGTLGLNEVEIDLAVRTTKSRLKQAADHAGVGVDRSSFEVGFTGSKPGTRHDVIQVKLKFKRPEHPKEGPQRLLEELNGTVKPQPLDGDTVPRFDPVYNDKSPTEPMEPLDGFGA